MKGKFEEKVGDVGELFQFLKIMWMKLPISTPIEPFVP